MKLINVIENNKRKLFWQKLKDESKIYRNANDLEWYNRVFKRRMKLEDKL